MKCVVHCFLCLVVFYISACGDSGKGGECLVNSDCEDGSQCISGTCQSFSSGGTGETAETTTSMTGDTTDVGCQSGEIECSGTCVEENTTAHCGGCFACPAAQENESVSCSEDGECVVQCEGDFVDLDPEVLGCECTPSEEVCDEVDNDCDGEIDEDVLNACGLCGDIPEEMCDGVDNDCDGDIDEEDAYTSCDALDNAVASQCEGGVCVYVCAGDFVDVNGDLNQENSDGCECLPSADPTEICDGRDNNCDGSIDEGCDDDNDGFCDVEITYIENEAVLDTCPNGRGDCQDGVFEVHPNAPEVCNTIDDDCNGFIDSADSNYADFCTNQNGVCQGSTRFCDAGGTSFDCGVETYKNWAASQGDIYSTGTLGDQFNINWNGEIHYDGKDNDCDGDIDERLLLNTSCSAAQGGDLVAGHAVQIDVDWNNTTAARGAPDNLTAVYIVRDPELTFGSGGTPFYATFDPKTLELTHPPRELTAPNGFETSRTRWPNFRFTEEGPIGVVLSGQIGTSGPETRLQTFSFESIDGVSWMQDELLTELPNSTLPDYVTHGPPMIHTSPSGARRVLFTRSDTTSIHLCLDDFENPAACAFQTRSGSNNIPPSPTSAQGQIRAIDHNGQTIVSTFASGDLGVWIGILDETTQEEIVSNAFDVSLPVYPAIASGGEHGLFIVRAVSSFLGTFFFITRTNLETGEETAGSIEMPDPTLFGVPSGLELGVDPDTQDWRILWQQQGMLYTASGRVENNVFGVDIPYREVMSLEGIISSANERRISIVKDWNPNHVVPIVISHEDDNLLHSYHLLPSGHLACIQTQ